jgi:hypothetical protein
MTEKNVALSLRATMWVNDGSATTNDDPIQFEVLGLPPGQSALIGKMSSRWQILRCETETTVTWEGDYETKEQALAALASTVSTDPGRRQPFGSAGRTNMTSLLLVWADGRKELTRKEIDPTANQIQFFGLDGRYRVFKATGELDDEGHDIYAEASAD